MVDDQAGGGDVGLDLVGADDQRPTAPAPGEPVIPAAHSTTKSTIGVDDQVRVPWLAQGADPQAQAVQIDGGRRPQRGHGPKRRHRKATVAIRAAR